MKELQIVFPTTLSDEEKHLKEMHEKLKELRRKLAERRNGSQGGDGSKNEKRASKRTLEEAAVATEELKKKIQSGVITVKKVNEKNTFKRARPLDRKLDRTRSISTGEEGEIVESNSQMLSPPAATSSEAKETPWSTSGASSSQSQWRSRESDSRGPTIYIRGYDLQTDSLTHTFEKFGRIVRVNIDDRQKSAFIQFSSEKEAGLAIRKMDGNMIDGISVRVSFARRQNTSYGAGETGRNSGSDWRPREHRVSSSSQGSVDQGSADLGGAKPQVKWNQKVFKDEDKPTDAESKRQLVRYDDEVFG